MHAVYQMWSRVIHSKTTDSVPSYNTPFKSVIVFFCSTGDHLLHKSSPGFLIWHFDGLRILCIWTKWYFPYSQGLTQAADPRAFGVLRRRADPRDVPPQFFPRQKMMILNNQKWAKNRRGFIGRCEPFPATSGLSSYDGRVWREGLGFSRFPRSIP